MLLELGKIVDGDAADDDGGRAREAFCLQKRQQRQQDQQPDQQPQRQRQLEGEFEVAAGVPIAEVGYSISTSDPARVSIGINGLPFQLQALTEAFEMELLGRHDGSGSSIPAGFEIPLQMLRPPAVLDFPRPLAPIETATTPTPAPSAPTAAAVVQPESAFDEWTEEVQAASAPSVAPTAMPSPCSRFMGGCGLGEECMGNEDCLSGHCETFGQHRVCGDPTSAPSLES